MEYAAPATLEVVEARVRVLENAVNFLEGQLAELRNRTYTGPMRHFTPPACGGVASDGGYAPPVRADSTDVASGIVPEPSLFGYVHVADEGEGYCDCCGKPASEHECPEVNDA